MITMTELLEVQRVLDKYGVTDDLLTEQMADREAEQRRSQFRLIVTPGAP